MRRLDPRFIVVAMLAALLGTTLVSGCSQKRAKMANGGATSDVKPSEYASALDKWTRERKVYQSLETRLLVNATYKSGAFRDAWVDENARRQVLSDADRDELKRREHDAADNYHEFFFAAYTQETRWNDFSRRDSIWRLRLFDDKGGSVEPLVVTRVKQDDPIVRAFYPYFTLWGRGYVVKFPRAGLAEDSKSLRLQMTSAVGAAELEYPREGADTSAPVRVENPGSTATTPATQ